MALKSILFRDDIKLEACLTRDSAHVTRGASGDHVAKIQTAVSRLDGYNIAFEEVRARSYGPSTAAAVLAYKKKRKIINRSYQTQADDIVGKMTIARLDDELATIERRQTYYDPRRWAFE
jgi:peptidoglycan hydrolase-like protein with peptidoglycan-binding domain